MSSTAPASFSRPRTAIATISHTLRRSLFRRRSVGTRSVRWMVCRSRSSRRSFAEVSVERRSPLTTSTMLVPALEVGGTHVTAAVVDVSAGQVLEATRSRRPLGSDDPASDIVRTLLEVAAPVAAAAARTATLGVAIPGPFDYARGIGRFEGVAKFESLAGLDVGAALRAGLAGEVAGIAFLNDADAFVLGEWALGAAAGHRRVAGITLGTGIGPGFLDDGRTYLGRPPLPPGGSAPRPSRY